MPLPPYPTWENLAVYFEEVMREIATIILVYLALALAAELLTRGLALG